MVDISDIQAYLKIISCRCEQWQQENALTDTIAAQQTTFTFEQFVQTEQQQSGDQPRTPGAQTQRILPLLEGIREYLRAEHVLLVGSPGVGKSSALWHCFRALANEELQASQPRIPVLLSLKRCGQFATSEDRSGLLGLIQDELYPEIDIKITEIKALLFKEKQKRFILLLDGLNEMSAYATPTELKEFRVKCERYDVPLICSTRELDGGDLGIRRKLKIQPLRSKETNRFLQECLPEHQDEVRQLLQRDGRELSRTPFVLWMLYHLLNETGTLAETLGEAFRQFFRFHFRKYKEDVPVAEARRQDWNLWLEELAFVMLNSPEPFDSGLVISREDAEKILALRFGELQNDTSRIRELEKYHLLTPFSNREISFQHQLIQEYYAAERLLEKLKKEPQLLQKQPEQEYSSFQMHYLNYLKWTEPLLIMMSLLNSPTTATQLTQLAIEVDLRLGSRIAGATSKLLQQETIKLLLEKNCQESLKIWLLQESQSSEAVLYLLDILYNGDSDHRWRAARALSKFEKVLVKDPLINSLTSGDDSVRRIAATSLKELGVDNLSSLICNLLNDEKWLIRSFAVDYLGDIGDEEAIRCLENALAHPDSTISSKAAKYLGGYEPQKTIKRLEEQLEEGSESKRTAISLLGETRSYLAFLPLTQALLDNDWILRSNAIASIGLLGLRLGIKLPEQVADKLIHLLQSDPDSSVRSSAAIHLGFARHSRALSSLIKALAEDKDVVVRRSIAGALGELQDLSAEKALIDCLRDEEIVVEESIKSLRLLQSRKALPYVRKFLKHKNPKLRKETVLSIGVLGDPKKDLDLLYKYLGKDKNFSVRLCSAYTLSQFKNRKGIPTLKEAVETGNKDARKLALYGIQNFEGKVELSTVVSIAVKDEEYSLRKEATDFLKRFSHIQEVREFLEKALRSNDEDIARYAMDAAKTLGYPEILELLNRITQSILVVERPLEAIQAIQSRCGFYNLTIQQEAIKDSLALYANNLFDNSIYTQTLQIFEMGDNNMNQPKYSINAKNNQIIEKNLGTVINEQAQSSVGVEQRKALEHLSQLVGRMRDKYPNATEQEILEKLIQNFDTMPQQNPKQWQVWRDLLSIIFVGGTETIAVFEPFIGIPIAVLMRIYEIYDRNRKQLPDK